MKFGPVPLHEAEGGILAHSLVLEGAAFKKGTVLDRGMIDRLRGAGLESVTVARLEEGDVGEDEAAETIAAAFTGPTVRSEPAFTGRANLFARAAGLLQVSRRAVDAVNRVDESITLATLGDHAPVEEGRMIGTVKIIPYGVRRSSLDRAIEVLSEGDGESVLRVAPFRRLEVAVVSTVLPGTPEKVLAKTVRTLSERLHQAGSSIREERRVAHDPEALATELSTLKGHDLVVVFGASAIADRRDVIPAGIEAAGGRVDHFGMPVDPGNLLLVGRLGPAPVIGAPGCARSPKENGFDWVLRRYLAGLPVTRDDVTGMGVGGLLMEIVSRPQPRRGPEARVADGRPRVAAVVLAAGQSRRMAGPNKLLATIGGRPLVRIAVEAAVASAASPVVVVTGHDAERVRAALAGLEVRFVHNPRYAEGLSTSLKEGLSALPEEADGALVMLSDMPGVTAETIDRLIAALDPAAGALIAVPTARGKRGNPVLWSRRFFDALGSIEGDVGGRHLIGANADLVAEVEIGEAATLDLDTPEALQAAGGRITP